MYCVCVFSMLKYRQRRQTMDNYLIDMGKKIKNARMEKKMLQKELADALNVSYVTLGRWERGLTPPTLPNQRKLEEILEIKL